MKAVLPGVKHHHEKWDGTGYPDGLRGDEIPMLARLLGVADFFDALASARAYRAAMSHDDVIRMIESGAGTQFEESLAALVARLHREGTLLPEGWDA